MKLMVNFVSLDVVTVGEEQVWCHVVLLVINFLRCLFVLLMALGVMSVAVLW